jgi:hypothetical protein
VAGATVAGAWVAGAVVGVALAHADKIKALIVTIIVIM